MKLSCSSVTCLPLFSGLRNSSISFPNTPHLSCSNFWRTPGLCAQDIGTRILVFSFPTPFFVVGFVLFFFLLMISLLGTEGTKRKVLGFFFLSKIWGQGDKLLSSDIRVVSLANVGYWILPVPVVLVMTSGFPSTYMARNTTDFG